MPTKLSNVRRQALVSALGVGLFVAESSAFETPTTVPSSSVTPQSTGPTTAPTKSKADKDAAARRTSAAAYGTQVVPASGQIPQYGVYTPLASAQGTAPSSQSGPGGGLAGGSAPGYGPAGGAGAMAPGMAGLGAGAAGAGAAGATAPGSAASPFAANPGGAGGGDAEGTFATGGSTSNFLPNVIGDLGPGVRVSAAPTSPGSPVQTPPAKTPPANDVTSILRVFKVSENQSPRPQDRFFYTFNYFDSVDKSINKLNNSPITGIKIYRHVFGFEKTFDEGRGSIGLSLPLYSQFANSMLSSGISTPGSTSLGDLNLFAKYILKENKKTGSLVSTGLLVTPPTGPTYLAGANYFRNVAGTFVPIHDLQIQPFLGYIFQRDRFYVQGFSALNVAVNPRDVSLFFNDIQFGYFLFRDRESDRFVTAIVPTFEVHVTDPINHRGVMSPDPAKTFQHDPYGTPDTVNLTYGINFEVRRNSILTLAFAEPVTAFKPFAYEAFVLFNYRFGRSRSLINPPPNVIGG